MTRIELDGSRPFVILSSPTKRDIRLRRASNQGRAEEMGTQGGWVDLIGRQARLRGGQSADGDKQHPPPLPWS